MAWLELAPALPQPVGAIFVKLLPEAMTPTLFVHATLPYDAGYRRIMVSIPIDVWEVIRLLGAAKLDLINSSDEELLELVEREVNERVAGYERMRSSDAEKAALLRFDNSIVFGVADSDPSQQIKRGMDFYQTERERQREITLRIAQHKIIDINSES
jgi:translation elongation factor EF-Tu-like GTPase